jgi:hypothetical protein
MFQKSYTGNILEIGRNKSQTSRNLPKLPENRRGDEEEPLVVTSQDFIKFWGKNFVFVLLEMIEISQGFKNFLSLFESFIRKCFKLSTLFLKTFLIKESIIKILLFPSFIQTYASLLAKE